MIRVIRIFAQERFRRLFCAWIEALALESHTRGVPEEGLWPGVLRVLKARRMMAAQADRLVRSFGVRSIRVQVDLELLATLHSDLSPAPASAPERAPLWPPRDPPEEAPRGPRPLGRRCRCCGRPTLHNRFTCGSPQCDGVEDRPS